MLKGIPEIISPELLKVLCEMGHGDKIVIADGNFAAASTGKSAIVIRCDGHGVPELLDAILKLFPLDRYVDCPITLLNVLPGDNVETPIWNVFKDIVSKYEKNADSLFTGISRSDFYDVAKDAYAIIATSEKALYANVILQKGVL